MAHRLTSGGTAAKHVTIPTCSLAGDFDITIVATQYGQTNGTFLFAGPGVAGQNGLDLYRNLSGKYQVFVDNTSFIAGTINASSNLAAPDTIRISRVSGVVTLMVNGVVDGTGNNSNTLIIDRFFHRNGWAHYGNMAFYTMSITAASGNRYYDASAGTQSATLVDTTSGQNGTLVGFSVPADWVFYNSITTTGIPNNTLGAALNQPCAINLNNYFTGATSYSVLSGSLPTGLSIVGNQIVGTPTSVETTSLVISASNSIDTLDSATITFNTGLWALSFAGGTNASGVGYVSHPEALFGASTFEIEIDLLLRSIASSYKCVISNNDTSNPKKHTMYFYGGSRAEISFIIGGTRRVIEAPIGTFSANVRYKVKIVYNGTTLEVFVDGVSKGSIAASGAVGGTRGLTLIGANPPDATYTTRADIDLYGYKITENGTLVRNYDPSASGGVGGLLIDRVSNQNGTQTNTWPADNSEWYNYIPSKWYLNNTSGADSRISIPSVTIGATVGDYLEIKAVANAGNPSGQYRLIGQNNSTFTNGIELTTTAVIFRAGGTRTDFTSGWSLPAVGTTFTVRFVRTSATGWEAFLNGVSLGSVTNANSLTAITVIGSTWTGEAFRGGIYHVAISTNGGTSATRYYDPSASNGSGVTLVDTINNANNGTQAGTWPTDDSEWGGYNPLLLPVYPPSRFVFPTGQAVNVNLDDYFDGATSYSVASGSLPAGLSIVGNLITGTPTVAGDSSFVLRGHSGAATLDTGLLTATVGLWYLQFTGGATSSTAGYITHPAALSAASTFDVEIDFTPRVIYASYYNVYSNNQSNNLQRHAMYMWGSSRAEIAFIIGGARILLNSPLGTFTAGTRYKVNAVYDGSTLQMLVNGVSVASVAATGTVGGSGGLTQIGANSTEARASIDLYSYKITQNGTLVRYYDPNTSGGVGDILIDRIGNNNAAQAGTWPSGNAEWVSYAPVGGSENKEGPKPNSSILASVQFGQQIKEAVAAVASQISVSSNYLYQVLFDIGGSFASLITISTSKASTKTVSVPKAASSVNTDIAGLLTEKTSTSVKLDAQATQDIGLGLGIKGSTTSKPNTSNTLDIVLYPTKNAVAGIADETLNTDVSVSSKKEAAYQKPIAGVTARFSGITYEISYGISGSFTSVVLASLLVEGVKQTNGIKPNVIAGFSGVRSSSKDISVPKTNSSASFNSTRVGSKHIISGVYSEISSQAEYGWAKAVDSDMVLELSMSWSMFGSSKNILATTIFTSSQSSSIIEEYSNISTKISYATKEAKWQ